MKSSKILAVLVLIPSIYACTPNVPSVEKSMLNGGSGSLNGNSNNPIINDISSNNPTSSLSIPLIDRESFYGMNREVESGELIRVSPSAGLDQFRVTGNARLPDEDSGISPVAAYIEMETDLGSDDIQGTPGITQIYSNGNNTTVCELRMSFNPSDSNSVKNSWMVSLTDTSSCPHRMSLLKGAKNLTIFFKSKDSSKTFN